jgi:carbamoyl-phosphate synthase small subunit
MKAILALEDGVVFEGALFGASGETSGEVVFNTSLTGYQEILTDPSYKGQLVTMTYPHIGNYGINREDEESAKPFVEGFIVRELSPAVSNWRSEMPLGEYLKRNNIVGIQGVDTRKLVRHLRDGGVKRGVISSVDLEPKRLIEKAIASENMQGADLVERVTCRKSYTFDETLVPEFEWPRTQKVASVSSTAPQGRTFKVVCVDGGVKRNILRKLTQHGMRVTVVPAFTKADEILALEPDGIFLSNGPGDPEAVTYLIDTVRQLIGRKPMFGICLGHQILGLALGGRTFKLKFGHRGGNHPVMDLKTERIEITSQNHGFAVDPDSLPKGEVELTHVNLNDRTLEGFRHKRHPLFAVQYHPENSPGPHDSDYLFKRFYDMLARGES